MGQTSTDSVFEDLTPKQFEALNLAAAGYTSKEIARQLEISPHSVDKRIDAIRAQLNAMPRQQLVREFREWNEGCHSTTGGQFPLTGSGRINAETSSQTDGEALVFNDVLTFDGTDSWNAEPAWLHRGVKPSDLGIGARLMFVFAGAFLMAAAFVLVAASGNVLVDMLS